MSIGAYAFESTGLHEIEIPSSVTSIGEYAVGYYYDSNDDANHLTDNFAIYGYGGTEAEDYANDNGITFFDNTVYLSADGLWKYCILPDDSAKLYSDIAWGYSYQGNASVVTIPSAIDGHTVTELGACSMSNLTFITKVIIPDTVKTIGFSAFSGCRSLEELVIPDSVEEIGAQVIDNTALVNDPANYEDGVLYIGDYLLRADPSFNGEISVREGTKVMALAAFVNCIVENVDLPGSITKIGDSMFYNCLNLRGVGMPDTITEIGFNAFTNCPKLNEIMLQASVVRIRDGNFIYHSANGDIFTLNRIYGFDNTFAEDYANDNGIDFISMSGGTTGDCGWAYDCYTKVLTICGTGAMEDYGMIIPNSSEIVDAPWRWLHIEKVVIDDGVTNIGQDAFIYSDASEAEIPDSVTSIGSNAFDGCHRLNFVTLPTNLESIGAYAFYNTGLREIDIPSGVTSIGEKAFGYYYDWDHDEDRLFDNFIIYGFGGTEAEDYANDNGITFYDNTVYLSADGLWKYCILPDDSAILYSDVAWGYSYQGNASVVTIPSAIDGHTVTELGACSMSNLTFITKVIIPDTVKTIGFSAFSGCTSLSDLVIPDSVEEIGAQVIDNTALINNPSNYENGGLYVDNCLLFVDRDYSGEFVFKDGTRLLSYFAIGNCADITSVVVNDGLPALTMANFIGCSSLREITIPESVNDIHCAFDYYDENAHGFVTTIETIFGHAGSYAEEYARDIGVSFEYLTSGRTGDCFWNYDRTTRTLTVSGTGDMKDYDMTCFAPWRPFDVENAVFENGVTSIGTDALLFSDVRNVQIADTVTSIGSNAFNECHSLASVILPSSLEYVGAYAFASTALQYIIIPSGVNNIETNAFGFYYDYALDEDLITRDYVVYGYTSTQAQFYANNNGIEFIAIDLITVGDSDNNTRVDDDDVTAIIEAASGKAEITKTMVIAGDVNGDGVIDAFDAAALDRIIY